MQMLASLKPGSFIERRWKHNKRIGGQISGVQFALAGKLFVTEPLEDSQVERLRLNPAVRIAILGDAATSEAPVTVVPEPVPGPVPEPEPEEIDDLDALLADSEPATPARRGRPPKAR